MTPTQPNFLLGVVLGDDFVASLEPATRRYSAAWCDGHTVGAVCRQVTDALGLPFDSVLDLMLGDGDFPELADWSQALSSRRGVAAFAADVAAHFRIPGDPAFIPTEH